jgi:peptidyl-prolyl cis-trans isomerase C
MENKVIATVNNKEIRQSDVEALYVNLGPNAAQYQGEAGYKQLIEQLILEEMLYSDAKENSLDTEKEYQTALEQLKRSLLAQYSVSKFMSNIDVSENEAEEYYNSNKSLFKSVENVTASHILVESLEKAEEVLKEINAGQDFAEAAQKHSSCPSKNSGGNLGKFGKGQMVVEFEDAVFAMKVGDISTPVKTQFGYHIIQLNEKSDSNDLTFDEAKQDIVNKLKYEKQNKVYAEKQNELKEKYPIDYKF